MQYGVSADAIARANNIYNANLIFPGQVLVIPRMSDWRVLRQAADESVVLPRLRWCASFWCHFRGLMLRRSLSEDEGLLFVYSRESISGTTIHMFFVFFAIAAVWLDSDGCVVDAKLARPWRPIYAPRGAGSLFD